MGGNASNNMLLKFFFFPPLLNLDLCRDGRVFVLGTELIILGHLPACYCLSFCNMQLFSSKCYLVIYLFSCLGNLSFIRISWLRCSITAVTWYYGGSGIDFSTEKICRFVWELFSCCYCSYPIYLMFLSLQLDSERWRLMLLLLFVRVIVSSHPVILGGQEMKLSFLFTVLLFFFENQVWEPVSF